MKFFMVEVWCGAHKFHKNRVFDCHNRFLKFDWWKYGLILDRPHLLFFGYIPLVFWWESPSIIEGFIGQ
jgi:hypothetical protein